MPMAGVMAAPAVAQVQVLKICFSTLCSVTFMPSKGLKKIIVLDPDR